jgi:tetratricopeptide (TPR) repeat protein
MAIDDDIAAQIPEPPLPAPLRRQAAIAEALRRFDGARGGEPVAAGPPVVPAPWWVRIGRPQAGALVTAGLVALFGVPAAWLSLSHRPMPVSQIQLASAPMADLAARQPLPRVQPEAPPVAPPAVVRPAAPAAIPQPAPAVSSGLLAADEGKDRCAGGDCAPGSAARAEANAPSAPAATMKLALADAAAPSETHAKQAYGARSDGAVEIAAAPPPPPPPAMVASNAAAASTSANLEASTQGWAAKASEPRDMIVSAQRREAIDDVVVTGMRRTAQKPAGRGDWNACTVDDPERSLGNCKRLVDPAAPGPSGRAAAHVADGLSRAWQGDFPGAIAAFDQAIEIAPRSSFAYLNRGLARQHRGEFDRAIADLDRAVRYAPGAARGYYNRAQLLRQRGQAARASSDEDRAVALDPGYDVVVR